jgi:hypothetical protein
MSRLIFWGIEYGNLQFQTTTPTTQEEFFIIVGLEFWKIHRLVAGQGDGWFAVAPKTIQRQANLHNKGMYNDETTFKSSHKFSFPKLQKTFTQKLVKQSTNKVVHVNFLLLTKAILANFVVELPGLNILIQCYKSKLHSGIEVLGFFSMRISCLGFVFTYLWVLFLSSCIGGLFITHPPLLFN